MVSLLRRKGGVLCLLAFSEIDTAAATMLAHLLRLEGVMADAHPWSAASGDISAPARGSSWRS